MGLKSLIEYFMGYKIVSELEKNRTDKEREMKALKLENERFQKKMKKQFEEDKRKTEEKERIRDKYNNLRDSNSEIESRSVIYPEIKMHRGKFNQLRIGDFIKLKSVAEVLALDDRDGHELEKRTIEDGVWEVELFLEDGWISISLNSEPIPDSKPIPKSHRSRIQRKYIKEILKKTSGGKKFNQLEQSSYIKLKYDAEIFPVDDFEKKHLPYQKWVGEGIWKVEEILEDDMIGISLSNGPIPHSHRSTTRRKYIKEIL